MNRKTFLKGALLSAFSMSMFANVTEAKKGKFVAGCETTNDILGPFYRPNAPVRSDLIFPNLEGTQINIKGKVFGDDCKTALEKASVELWHCDSKGNYDNNSQEFRHRGTNFTSQDGAYSFKTIIPGKYLNGRLYRPAHLHFMVKAAGYKTLISQLYFEGDPHITEDPWASQPKAQHRILPVFPDDIESNLSIAFDISLESA